MGLLLRLQLAADVRAELHRLAAVVELHAGSANYPTRGLDGHRLVGYDPVFLGNDVQIFAGENDRAIVRTLCGRLAHSADIAREVSVLAIARDGRAIGGNGELRRTGIAESDYWRFERGCIVVGIVTGNPRRERLPDSPVCVEALRLDILYVDVWVVTPAAVERRSGALHLSVEPVGERGKRAQHQHWRPGDQPVKGGVACFHCAKAFSSG